MELQFVKRHDCVEALNGVLSASSERQATRHFKNHIPRLSWAFSMVPIAKSADQKLLDIGSKLDILGIFRERHGYAGIGGSVYTPGDMSSHEPGEQPNTVVHRFDGERSLIFCEPGAFNAVTCLEVIEHMTSDPMALMGNINHALAMGGYLVISTVNCASLSSIKKIIQGRNPFLYCHFNLGLSANRHNKEYTTRELMRTVRAGGFEIVKTITPFVFSKDDPDFTEKLKALGCDAKFLGDDTVILARKISNDIVRFPSHLYVGGDDERKVSSDRTFSSSSAVAAELRKVRALEGLSA